MMQKLTTDVVIIGGGIAGLWLLNRLRQQGYSAILLEQDTLGGGQTHKSQGIIHGGMKYALQGALSSASEAIVDMPTIWAQCLKGQGEIDLSKVPILSHHQYLWSTSKLAGKLAGFFAGLMLQGRVAQLKPNQFPLVFKNPQFNGVVYSLDEMAIDVHALIQELVVPQQHAIYKVDNLTPDHLHFDNNGNLSHLTIYADNVSAQVSAEKYIFTAGAGNENLLSQFSDKGARMQRRPLRMVMMKTDISYPVYAHCLGASATPRITITTHPTADGKMVWYLGGQLAEEGVKLSDDEQTALARKELAALFPWLDFSNARFASFLVDRAESYQPDGKRPDQSYLKNIANMLVAWPTKLAFAPKLTAEILQALLNENIKPIADAGVLSGFSVPLITKPVWEEL